MLILYVLAATIAFASSTRSEVYPGMYELYALLPNTSDTLSFDSEQLERLYALYNLDTRPVTSQDNASTTVLYAPPKTGMPAIKMHATRTHAGPSRAVSHIGFDLFTAKEKQSLFPTGDFLERYFLYLMTVPDATRQAYLTSDGMAVAVNEIQLGNVGAVDLPTFIELMDRRQSIRLERREEVYTVYIADGSGNRATLHIPARRDLLSGKDKKELDDELGNALFELMYGSSGSDALVRSFSGEHAYQPAPQELIPYQNELHMTREPAILPGMHGRSYFLRKGNTSERVYDRDFPLESLANELMLPRHLGHTSVHLVHKTYDRDYKEYDLDLTQLIYYLKADADIFIGFEQETPGAIRSTHLFKNNTYNTMHMLSIDWPPDLSWSSEASAMPAVLYTNIRFDNVEDLFGEYIEDYTREKIQVQISNKR